MAKKHAKTKDKPEAKVQKGNARATKGAVEKRGAVTPGKELSNKDYDRALKKLHVELVKLQEWVVHKGLKVCILFEGRDGAGKGGTIKRFITGKGNADKAAVIASSTKLEHRFRQALGQLAGAPVDVTEAQGIDFAVGRARREHASKSKLQARITAVAKRRRSCA